MTRRPVRSGPPIGPHRCVSCGARGATIPAMVGRTMVHMCSRCTAKMTRRAWMHLGYLAGTAFGDLFAALQLAFTGATFGENRAAMVRALLERAEAHADECLTALAPPAPSFTTFADATSRERDK